MPAPEGGPPAAFVQAVELGLRAAEAEARRRLEKLIQQAQEGVAAEKEAAGRRLRRWLTQSKVKPAEAEKALAAEAAVYDGASAALEGARLELDQVSLVQLA